ncbi:3654_t:CDS:2 [Ambispora leptoticha]|uniref:3654_t:CDS:1 n=1 Tax=Ambispora leptoticha TaxID=144679 RepID=A0A9N8WG09_9GLOM|nr:3654_t:CDS:2 [Ambispora leptoticha]
MSNNTEVLPASMFTLLPESLRNSSLYQIEEFIKIHQEQINQTTIFIYTTNHVFYLMILYFSAKIIERALKKYSPDMSIEHLRNCTTYILEIFVTTVGLCILLAMYNLIINKEISLRDYKLGQVVALLICDLYIFELLYRTTMRRPLIAHHLTTMVMMSLSIYVIVSGGLTVYPHAILLLFQATTEQSTFLGLLFYRIKPKYASDVLLFSSIQVFIVKVGTLAWCFVFWAQDMLPNKDHLKICDGWNVIFPIGAFILFLTQLWATYVVYKIAKRSYRKHQQQLTDLDTVLPHSEYRDSATTIAFNFEKRHSKKISDDDSFDSVDELSGMLQDDVLKKDYAEVEYFEIKTAGNVYKPHHKYMRSEVRLTNGSD